MEISLDDEKGKDGESQTAKASHGFIPPTARRWVEQEKGYVVDGHGDQCKHLQRTAAETLQQDKVVLHLLNSFLVLHNDSRSHNRHRLGVDMRRQSLSISFQEVGQWSSPSDGRNFPDFNMMGCASA